MNDWNKYPDKIPPHLKDGGMVQIMCDDGEMYFAEPLYFHMKKIDRVLKPCKPYFDGWGIRFNLNDAIREYNIVAWRKAQWHEELMSIIW